MKTPKRLVIKGIVNHCYQRTVEGFVIFYSVSDFLCFFTEFCMCALKHNVKIVKLCLMYDHIHFCAICDSSEQLASFVQEYTSRFSRKNNRLLGIRGNFFCSPFGSASKKGDKAARTTFIYCDNNPVERKMVSKAEEYRWNFLAYAMSDHPFSEPLVISKASRAMVKAVNMVKAQRKSCIPLSYQMIQNLFADLVRVEKEQLVDYIITSYSVIDHDYCQRFFNSCEDMLLATHANTGSEYDINETFIGKSDRIYPVITNYLLRTLKISDIHEVLSYPVDTKILLFNRILADLRPTHVQQVAKYLHMTVKPADKSDY